MFRRWPSRAVVACFLLLAGGCSAPEQPRQVRLEVRERAPSAGGTRTFVIRAAQSEIWLIGVAQTTADVAVELRDSDRQTVLAVDSPGGRAGHERMLVAVKPQTYSLVVTNKDSSVHGAALSLRVVEGGADDAGVQTAERLEARAAAAYLRDAPREALAAYEETVDAWRRAEQRGREGLAQFRAASLLFRLLSEPARATENAHLAAAAFEGVGDERMHAQCLLLAATSGIEAAISPGLAPRRREAGILRARRDALAAAAGFVRVKDPYGAAESLRARAEIEYYVGRYDEAAALFRQATAQYEKLGEILGAQKTRASLAQLYFQLGRFRDSIGAYDELLREVSPEARPGLYSDMLDNSALARAVVGDFEGAAAQFLRALEIHKRLKDRAGQARSLHGSWVSPIGSRAMLRRL